MRLLGWATFVCWYEIQGHVSETDQLRYYETLSHVHVSSHVKRSSASQVELVKRIHFHSFQRDFHLTLKPGASVLAKDFQARLIHKDGSSTKLSFDQSHMFTGYDTNNAQSAVHAHLEESLWSIHILEKDEIYTVEPAWKILKPSENPLNDTMVAYRMSDLKDFTNGRHFCSVSEKQVVKSQQDLKEKKPKSKGLAYSTHVRKREKRNSGKKEVCLVYLVGDAAFYKGRCRSNQFSCLALMVQRLQFADDIYRLSPFEDSTGRKHLGIGMQVGELILYTDYTPSTASGARRHFNEDHEWEADPKLDSFASYMGFTNKRYCLNHLFSELSDQKGTLGLAYVNQICKGRRGSASYNSGLTSGTNSVGFLVPSLTQALVFTHEIGHNFGAHHDPDTPECAPHITDGGKFIMWQYSVSGYFKNNLKFSKCTLRAIGRNVPGYCFIERTKPYSFCGNGFINNGEECDAGFFGSQGNNKCCTKECTLRSWAVCSEINHECCVDCQVAPNTSVCGDFVRTYSCRKQSYCSGTSLQCIDRGFMPDGSKCGELHKCYGGKCLSPCELETRRLKNVKLKPCFCKENASEACMWCCLNATDPNNLGKCKPLLPVLRNDGTQCFRGTCQSGVCQTDIKFRDRTVVSTWFQYVKTSSVEKLLRTNLIMLVIVSSLIVWVPSALWITYLDCKEQRELEQQLRIAAAYEQEHMMRGSGPQDSGTAMADESDSSDAGTTVDSMSTTVVSRASNTTATGFTRKLLRARKMSLESQV